MGSTSVKFVTFTLTVTFPVVMLAPSSGDVMVTFASAVGVTFTVGVGVTFTVGVGVTFTVGVGVTFTVGVGVTFTVGVGVTFTVGVGVTLKACWTGLPFRRTGTSGPGNSKTPSSPSSTWSMA